MCADIRELCGKLRIAFQNQETLRKLSEHIFGAGKRPLDEEANRFTEDKFEVVVKVLYSHPALSDSKLEELYSPYKAFKIY